MARAYGFRVFVIEAFPNRSMGNDPFNAAAGSTLTQEISLLLRRLEAKGTQRYEPRPDPDGNITKPVRTATVRSSTAVTPDLLHATIAVGVENSHANATKPNKKTRNLKGWSAEADHVITFVFPKTTDSHFFLVTETDHRRDPHLRLLAMLRAESMIVRRERQSASDHARKVARERGETPEPKTNFKRLAFEAKQASDNDYLDEILSGADAATVVFKSKTHDAKGGPEYVDRVLQIKLRNENILEVGRKVSRSWAEAWRAGRSTGQQEAVSEVSGLLVKRNLFGEDEGSHYESAAITVRGKSEASTTIAVDTLRDAFTYPVSDLRPSVYSYYEKVGARLHKIARQEEVEINAIDAHEVSRCLTDSTPAES
jgi:hypothetical protein